MSNLVLYRKYRPLNFSDVVGQEHIKTTLKNSVKNGRIGHAYLFTGPRGVGKTTLARIYARAVNCPNQKDGPPGTQGEPLRTGEPCNTCDLCKEFLNSTSLDILEIDAASHTGVDNIRELIEHLQFAPTRATYKVIIIDEVHMLSKGAFNALLKTLEEPPKHAIFVLATTEIHKVPATIVSRTQRFDFKKASVSDLISRLEFVCKDNNIQASKEALMTIASAADGSFRDGLSLLDQVFNFATEKLEAGLVEDVLGLTSIKSTHDFLELILGGKTIEAVNFISKITFDGKDLYQFQKDFLEYLRKALIIKIGAKLDLAFTVQMQEEISAVVSNIDLAKLIQIIEIFQKAGSEIKWATIQSLPLELAAVEASNLSIGEIGSTVVASEAKQSGTITEIASSPSAPRNGGDLQTILDSWPQILDKLKDYNHSLIPSLKLAKPIRVEGKELIISFPYKFHKDAVEQRKNRIVVDQVIEEVIGVKLMIKPILEKNQTTENVDVPENPNDVMQSALKIMGGEIEK